MQPAPQNPDEFESVKKLLALKRHEEPPPGYFDRLPGEVHARIAHARANPEPWWRRGMAAWDSSPALATSYAVVVVALLLGGVWISQKRGAPGGPDVATTPVPQLDTNQPGMIVASNSAPPGLFNPPTLQVQPAEFKK